jgi:hypothetical protein
MALAVNRWSAAGFVARLILLALTGTAWAARSAQEVLLHPDYVHPVTGSDWLSIWLYTAAWLFTAASLIVFGEVAGGNRIVRLAIGIVAIASFSTGVANLAEDAFEVAGFGSLYLNALLVAGLGMLVLAGMTLIGDRRRLAFVPAVGALAAITMVLGGGVLALAAWFGFGVVIWRERAKGGAPFLDGQAPTGP